MVDPIYFKIKKRHHRRGNCIQFLPPNPLNGHQFGALHLRNNELLIMQCNDNSPSRTEISLKEYQSFKMQIFQQIWISCGTER